MRGIEMFRVLNMGDLCCLGDFGWLGPLGALKDMGDLYMDIFIQAALQSLTTLGKKKQLGKHGFKHTQKVTLRPKGSLHKIK